jgi:hypothetical protein
VDERWKQRNVYARPAIVVVIRASSAVFQLAARVAGSVRLALGGAAMSFGAPLPVVRAQLTAAA